MTEAHFDHKDDGEKLQILTGKNVTITSFTCPWMPEAGWEQVRIPDEEFAEPDIVARVPSKLPRWRRFVQRWVG